MGIFNWLFGCKECSKCHSAIIESEDSSETKGRKYRIVKNLDGEFGVQIPNHFNDSLWGGVLGWYPSREAVMEIYESYKKHQLISSRKNTFDEVD